jgi:ribonuclease BN (tRNA processing enzyme)
MRVNVLGYFSPYPPPDGAGPGYLLEHGGEKVLLDCGSGVVSRLGTMCNFRKGELSAVILSHLHPDHFCDLLVLRYAHFRSMLERGVGPLKVYAPDKPELERAVIAHQSLDIHTIAPGDLLSLGSLDVSFFPTNHPYPCCGMRIESGGKILVYTGDTAWDANLVDHCRQADLLMVEASFLEADKGENVPRHMSALDCGTLAERSKAKRLLLTHFWPEYDPEELRREAAKAYAGDIILAGRGLSVEV